MERLTILEFFAGIGGCAVAAADGAQLVAAVDIQTDARRVYQRYWGHPYEIRTIESLPDSWYAARPADLWWLSPPCQPFTRRGRQRDTDDPRCAALLAMLQPLARFRPPFLLLENVPGFAGSQAEARLLSVLRDAGYEVRTWLLCPTEWGVPNRRRRYYLAASRRGWAPPTPPPRYAVRLRDMLDDSPDPRLVVPSQLLHRFRQAMHVVDPRQEDAVAACFTSAYGRSVVRSGSYLATQHGLRRFAPNEILRLLGFPAWFSFPPDMPLQTAWSLVGNSLSVPAVRFLLGQLPNRPVP